MRRLIVSRHCRLPGIATGAIRWQTQELPHASGTTSCYAHRPLSRRPHNIDQQSKHESPLFAYRSISGLVCCYSTWLEANPAGPKPARPGCARSVLSVASRGANSKTQPGKPKVNVVLSGQSRRLRRAKWHGPKYLAAAWHRRVVSVRTPQIVIGHCHIQV